MNILLIGGFLGSGKTTIINKLIHDLAAFGLITAIIENEIGNVGIDDIVLGETGIKVTPLFGGCVCCEISGDLIQAVDMIASEINPNWIIIEMTGFAFMDSIREVFRKYASPDYLIHTLSVVDVSRWAVFMLTMRPVIERQLADADVVIVNKIDENSNYEQYLAEISKMSLDAPCIPLCAKTVTDTWLWDKISAIFNGDVEENK